MKINLLIPILFLGISIIAQEKMVTKNGIISFEASVTAFEEVKAKNTGVSCVLNTKTGEIASLALMKGFKFKIALMEEHFNENYIESVKYPKATFKGKIENFDISKVINTVQNYTLKGKLELHGKTKDIFVIAKIRKTNDGLEISSDFAVNNSDFAIEIPSIVGKKISEKVNVSLDFLLK